MQSRPDFHEKLSNRGCALDFDHDPLSGKRPRKVGEKSFNRCTVSTKPGKLLMDRSPVWNNFFFLSPPLPFFFLFSND